MPGVFDINDKSSYKSNQLLKPAGTEYQYTKEEIQEYIKCKKDPVYFIESYIKIVHPDKGLIPFKLFDYQKEMIANYTDNRFSISMLARQMGKTTTVAAWFVWFTIFNPNKTCAILANKAMVAKEILQRYQEAYQHIPKFLQQGVIAFNKTSVELENGSRIFASSTSGDAVRGFALSCVYLDEFAFVKPNIADEFFTSVFPTISSGKETKLIITSTPNGYNHFYKLWNEAIEGISDFSPFLAKWDAHPWRDEKWKEEQMTVLGPEKFDQEMLCSFLGGTNTLISSNTLSTLSPKKPLIEKDGIRIYEEAKPGRTYMMFVDASEGLGKDSHAFTIIDVTEFPMRIVAVYTNNAISHLLLPTILEQFGLKYNRAGILIETNSTGLEVANILWRDLEYEDLIIIEKANKREYGVRMTTKTKRIGCLTLKDLIEEKKILFNDLELISQLSNFVRKNNTYKADEGHNDDIVMTLVNMAWFSTTDMFINLTNQDFKNLYRQQHQENIEAEMLPFGYIENGLDDDSIIDNDGMDIKSLISSNRWLLD